MTALDRLSRVLMTAVALLGCPAGAFACPVCFAAKDEAERLAFLASTVFLTALPLILMGAFIGWAARRAKALEAPMLDSEQAPSDLRLFPPDSESAAAEPSRVVLLGPADSTRG
jgi:hypothetical protein